MSKLQPSEYYCNCANLHASIGFFSKCDTNLLESVLQDLEGLRQVSRLSPGPHREQRAAGGQRQSHQGQGSPDDTQLAHSPPLQNPLHICCTPHSRSLTHRRRPSEIHALTPFQQSIKSTRVRFTPNVPFICRERALARSLPFRGRKRQFLMFLFFLKKAT